MSEADAAEDAAGLRFVAIVREARGRAGISQSELARRMAALGWPYYPQTVQRLEAGQRKVGIGEAVALSVLLQFDLNALTEGIHKHHPCDICADKPPVGFTCNLCGRSGS